ncbi:MAG: hypothetical protein JWQ25_1692 [Daejeonella sp.]|nr:hypothetical protein [Daejeonella sp.]
MKKEAKNILREPEADYEKAEIDLLKRALSSTYTERFQRMTTLMKMNIMFRKAVIKHKPFTDD